MRFLARPGTRKVSASAAGLSGVDDGTIYVEPMWHPLGNLGRVGDIQDVDVHLLRTLIDAEIVPVGSRISLGEGEGESRVVTILYRSGISFAG